MPSFYCNAPTATPSFAVRRAFAAMRGDARLLLHAIAARLTSAASFANREGHADSVSQHADSDPSRSGDRLGKPIRILLVDDHSLVRENLRLIIDHQPEFEVIAEATNGHEAIGLAEQLRPDVVLMDISMPKVNGIKATRLITTAVPGTRVIALSMHDDPSMTQSMLDAGAAAYLIKGGSPHELIATIHRVHNAK